MINLLGLRTIIYPAPDLAAARAWFTRLLDKDPYFDEPFYVGFEVAGYELALNPALEPTAGPITYWGVPNADTALQELVSIGATVADGVTDVGGDIRVATVSLPGSGATFGIIENPHFQLPVKADQTPDGPGR